MIRTANLKILLFIITPILSISLMLLQPSDLSALYKGNWWCLCICFSFCIFILAMMYLSSYIDIFSPVTVVSVIYLLMFYLVPLYDIAIGETSIFGVDDLFYYGVKSTVFATIGFVSFALVYAIRAQKIAMTNIGGVERLSDASRNKIAQVSLCAWWAVFAISLILKIVISGQSISYILSFGTLGGSTGKGAGREGFEFLYQFMRSLLSFYLIYFCTGRDRVLKVIMFVLTAMLLMIDGFRYLIIIFIIAFAFFGYLSRGKKPRGVSIVAMLLLLILVTGVMGVARGSVRNGAGVNVEGFDFQNALDQVLDNFRIYKTYYGVVKAVPRLTPYIYGKQIIEYTLIMAIPRAIWPGKPGNPGALAQLYGLGEDAVNSGYAYPCLGEYYYGFGIFGIIVFMAIMGLWLAEISNKYRANAKSNLDIARYCVISAAMFQLIIRGYTPSNFYFILVLIFPFVIMKRLKQREQIA